MKRLMRLAARLYPSAWRTRYGDEFAALLEDAGGGCREWLDVLWGALKMQIRMGSFWRLAAGFALAGVAIAGFIALRMPDRYSSTALLRVNATNPSVRSTLPRAEVDVLSRGSLAEVIQKLDLYKGERQRMPLEDVVQRMRRRDIRIAPVVRPIAGGPMTIQVQFAYPDPAAAERATALLSTRLAEAQTGSAEVEVLEPASWPVRLPQTDRIAILAVGLAGGLAVAVLIFGIRRWPTVAASAAAVAILAGGLSFLIPDRYTSSTVLRASSTANAAPLLDRTIRSATSEQSLARIIQQPQLDVYHRERQKMTIDQVVKLMRASDLQVERLAGDAYRIHFTYPNRYKAQALLREVDERIIEASAPPFVPSVSHTPEGVLRSWVRPAPPVEVLDPASFPEEPVSPNREAIAAIGLVVGLAMGTLARAMKPVFHLRSSAFIGG